MSSREQLHGQQDIQSGTPAETGSMTERVIHDPFGSVIAGVVATCGAFGFVITGMWGIGLIV